MMRAPRLLVALIALSAACTVPNVMPMSDGGGAAGDMSGGGGGGGGGGGSQCPCQSGYYCDLAVGQCKPGCAGDTDCTKGTAGAYCNTTTHACVSGCRDDQDCPMGSGCDSNSKCAVGLSPCSKIATWTKLQSGPCFNCMLNSSCFPQGASCQQEAQTCLGSCTTGSQQMRCECTRTCLMPACRAEVDTMYDCAAQHCVADCK
jgi:hypothetical protein